MRSKVTAVTYLQSSVIDTVTQVHSGVNDTAVPCAAESDSRIKKTVLRIIHEYIQQRWLHRGANDTAVHSIFVEYLHELGALFKRLYLCIRAQGKLSDEKISEVGNLVSGALYGCGVC
jgi:hypothetical protein